MMDECTMLPRKSFSVLLLLKLWWPLQQQDEREEQQQGQQEEQQRREVWLAKTCSPPRAEECSPHMETAAAAAAERSRSKAVRATRRPTYQSWPTTNSAQNMVPWANQ